MEISFFFTFLYFLNQSFLSSILLNTRRYDDNAILLKREKVTTSLKTSFRKYLITIAFISNIKNKTTYRRSFHFRIKHLTKETIILPRCFY